MCYNTNTKRNAKAEDVEMIFKDYYKILGLETNKVTIDQIKVAYRDQAKKYHPDVNQESGISEERFKDINEAYKILSNPTTRRKYDRMWNSRIRKKKAKGKKKVESSGSIVKDFLGILFGESIIRKERKVKETKVKVKGENVETDIEISIEEAYFGTNKKISLRAVDGKMKHLDVKIPAGILENEKIRLIGLGKAGKNGGKNGDLLIKVTIDEKSELKLIGYDLYTDLKITPWEAALGKKIQINILGEDVNIVIPPCTSSGEVIKVESMGYKDGKGKRGNLLIEIKIVLPKRMTEEEKKIYQKLEKLSSYNPRNAILDTN